MAGSKAAKLKPVSSAPTLPLTVLPEPQLRSESGGEKADEPAASPATDGQHLLIPLQQKDRLPQQHRRKQQRSDHRRLMRPASATSLGTVCKLSSSQKRQMSPAVIGRLASLEGREDSAHFFLSAMRKELAMQQALGGGWLSQSQRKTVEAVRDIAQRNVPDLALAPAPAPCTDSDAVGGGAGSTVEEAH